MIENDLSVALHQSQERFSVMFEQAPLGVFLFDQHYRVSAHNPRFVQMLRSPVENVEGLDLTTLEDQRVMPAMKGALAGQVTAYEGPFEPRDGEHQALISVRLSPLRDAQGKVMGAIGLIEDITERIESQHALERSEARFRALIERSPDAIGVYRDRKFVFVNPAMVTTLGYAAPSELLGVDIFSVIHPSDQPLIHEGDLSPVEVRVLRRDGSTGFIEIVSMPIDFDGSPSMLSVARDTTERRIMQAELLQADRMASVGTLAAGVAHEINNPLAYMKANLDGLGTRKLAQLAAHVDNLETEALRGGSKVALAEAQSIRVVLADVGEMVRLAREGADQVRSIVADLKTFSRSDDAPSSWVDVQRVLDAAIHMAWSEIRARGSLMKTYEAVPNVYANESRLAQVFLNVLLNAAHALGDAHPQGAIHAVTSTTASGHAMIVIRDNGAGMTPEVLARIFDPFFTTKPTGLGTGLGLWICQGIVNGLGGRISVASEPGNGTAFTIVLPPAEVPKQSEPRIPIRRVGTRKGRVLVVDDEVQVTRVVERALRDKHLVTSAQNGEAALEILKTDADFNVVLCDIGMPVMGGIDFYERAVALRPALASRFVFLTGGATDERSRAFLDRGKSQLAKPFETQDLLDVVDSRMGKW